MKTKTVLLLALLLITMFIPLIPIKNVSATIDPNPLPTDPYPYFSDGLHQWVFENNLDDTGSGEPDYDLVGNPIYNTTILNIRTDAYCVWFDGSNSLSNPTFLDKWRTNYTSGWGLSIWYYAPAGQGSRRLMTKINSKSPFNGFDIMPGQVTMYVDGTARYEQFSYLINVWNQITISQNSSGYYWLWHNGELIYETGDFNDVPIDGTRYDLTFGTRYDLTNNCTGAIDDVRFYGETLNQTYVNYLWTAPNIPTVNDWWIDADTELYNEDDITLSDGSIIIGINSPAREVNFTAYNTNFYFNASDNGEGITPNGTRMNFVNLTNVNLINLTDKWEEHDFAYFSGLYLTDVYLQHVGNEAVNREGIRILPGPSNNKPIRIDELTLYDVNGTGISFYSCDAETDLIVNDVNITRYSNSGIVLGSSFGSAPQGGTFTDIYIYTELISQHAIISYGENLVWDNLELVGHHLLAPHKLFQWQGDNTIIQNSLFRDCDNGIWLLSADHTLYVYDSIIENCADGFDSGAGTVYAYNVTFDGTRDRTISMELAGATFYLSDCLLINTLVNQHDIYYRQGNITFINTSFRQPYDVVAGDYLRNVYQHWNFSTSNVYINCTTNDDETNLNVAIQSTTWLIEADVPKLTIEVDAPNGSSELIIYCGENGEPSSIYVKGVKVETWSYDSTTSLVTLTVSHSSVETITVFWSEIATTSQVFGAIFFFMLIAMAMIMVFGVRRKN